jgi:hypothetical protein
MPDDLFVSIVNPFPFPFRDIFSEPAFIIDRADNRKTQSFSDKEIVLAESRCDMYYSRPSSVETKICSCLMWKNLSSLFEKYSNIGLYAIPSSCFPVERFNYGV